MRAKETTGICDSPAVGHRSAAPAAFLQFMQKLRRVFGLNPTQVWYLSIATMELLMARLRFAVIPTIKVIQHLNISSAKVAPVPDASLLTVDLKMMSWALQTMGTVLPWRSDCILQAMAGMRWMRRHGLRGSFFLGVSRTGSHAFKAHAWLRYGDMIVTGGNIDGFSVLIEPPAS